MKQGDELTEKVVGPVCVGLANERIEEYLQIGDGGVPLGTGDAVVAFGGCHGVYRAE